MSPSNICVKDYKCEVIFSPKWVMHIVDLCTITRHDWKVMSPVLQVANLTDAKKHTRASSTSVVLDVLEVLVCFFTTCSFTTFGEITVKKSCFSIHEMETYSEFLSVCFNRCTIIKSTCQCWPFWLVLL